MSDIPGARNELLALADELDAAGDSNGNRVRQIVDDYLFRARPVRKMPPHSKRVTDSMRERILDLAEHTSLDNAQIAAEVDVNPGRVSEVLTRRYRNN